MSNKYILSRAIAPEAFYIWNVDWNLHNCLWIAVKHPFVSHLHLPADKDAKWTISSNTHIYIHSPALPGRSDTHLWMQTNTHIILPCTKTFWLSLVMGVLSEFPLTLHGLDDFLSLHSLTLELHLAWQCQYLSQSIDKQELWASYQVCLKS